MGNWQQANAYGAVTYLRDDGSVAVGLDLGVATPSSMDEQHRSAVDLLGGAVANGHVVLKLGDEDTVQVFGLPFTLRHCLEEDVQCPPETILHEKGHGYTKAMYVYRDGWAALARPQLDLDTHRVCRWCAGDGLNAMLSNRVRIRFTESTSRQSSSDRYSVAGRSLRVVPGVSRRGRWHSIDDARPFNEWWEWMLAAGLDPRERLRPFAREAIVCPRCNGSGRP